MGTLIHVDFVLKIRTKGVRDRITELIAAIDELERVFNEEHQDSEQDT
jgi:hypothetical protein